MENSIITYETLYDALRRERSTSELQKLDKNFFKSVINYLEEKESILTAQKSSPSLESNKTQLQIDNIKRLLQELYEKRENKILQLAILSSRVDSNLDTASMLAEEKLFYSQLLITLNKYRKGILYNILKKNYPQFEDAPKELKSNVLQQDTTKLVRFIHPIPKFVGEDMNEYGPFEAEDIANLPEKVANLLIDKKRATSFKV